MICKIIPSDSSTRLIQYLVDEKPHDTTFSKTRNYSLSGINVDPLYYNKQGTPIYDSKYTALQYRATMLRAKNPKKNVKAIHLILSASGEKEGDFPLPKSPKDTKTLAAQADQMRKLSVGFVKHHFPMQDGVIGLIAVQRDGAGLKDANNNHVKGTGWKLHSHIVLSSVTSSGKVIGQNYTSLFPRTPNVYDKSLGKKVPGKRKYPGLMDDLNSFMEQEFPKVTGRQYHPVLQSDQKLVGTVRGYSWKQDMIDRIYSAYEHSSDLKSFIRNCPNEGIHVEPRVKIIGQNKDGSLKKRNSFLYSFYGQDRDKNGKAKYHEAYDFNIVRTKKGGIKKRGLGTAFTPQNIEREFTLQKEELQNEGITIQQNKPKQSIKIESIEPELVPAIHYFKQATDDLSKSAEDDDRQRSRKQREAQNAEQQRQQFDIIHRLNQQNNARIERENKRAKQREKYLKLIAKLKQLEQFKYTKPRLGNLESAFRANPELAQQLTNIPRVQQLLGLEQTDSNVGRNIESAPEHQESVKQDAKKQKQQLNVQKQEQEKPHVNIQNKQKQEAQTNVPDKQNAQASIPQKENAKPKIVGRDIIPIVNKLEEQRYNQMAAKEGLTKQQASDNIRYAKRSFTRQRSPLFEDKSGKILTDIEFSNQVKAIEAKDPAIRQKYGIDDQPFAVNRDGIQTSENEDKFIDEVLQPIKDQAAQEVIQSGGRINPYKRILNHLKGEDAISNDEALAEQSIDQLVRDAYGEEAKQVPGYEQTIKQAVNVLAANVGQNKQYKNLDSLKEKLQQDVQYKRQQELKRQQKQAKKHEQEHAQEQAQINQQLDNVKNRGLDNGQDVDDDKK